MATLFDNVISGVVDDNPLSSGATTLNSSALANLSAVTGSDIMWITLDPDAVGGAPEIVKVTAHTALATSATIVRAQQGTSARAHLQNTVWKHAVTASDLDAFLTAVTTADIEADAVTAAKLADDAVVAANIVDLNVTTAKIAADAVTGAKIADDQIDSEHYVAGSIDTEHIADDAVTGAKLDPSLPLGVVAYAQSTSVQSFSTTTEADVSGLTVTWTADASRLYRISYRYLISYVSGTTSFHFGKLTDASNTQVLLSGLSDSVALGDTPTGFSDSMIVTGLSGSITRKVRHYLGTSSSTSNVGGAATSPAYILVEDIGAA